MELHIFFQFGALYFEKSKDSNFKELAIKSDFTESPKHSQGESIFLIWQEGSV